jgi:hypothetical protein
MSAHGQDGSLIEPLDGEPHPSSLHSAPLTEKRA